MKKILWALALTLGTASAASYKIDSHHANLRFHIDHFGTSTNSAGIYGLEGTVDFDAAAKTGAVALSIPLDKISSGHPDFDAHLKSPDIFNVAQNKEIKFKSTAFEFDGEKVKSVKGDLTLNGKTHPITLNATKFNCYDSPLRKTQVCGGDFETVLDRSQWGIDCLIDKGMSKDEKVVIQIAAAKQD